MKNLNLFLLLIVVILLGSCATPRERAEKLIKRANKIFPIDSTVAHQVHLDTVLVYDTVIVVDSSEIRISIPIRKLDTTIVMGKEVYSYRDIEYKNKILINNERSRLTVTSSNGSLFFTLLLKEQKIRVQGTIRFKHTIKTYRTLITITVKKKDFFWWTGLIVIVGGSCLFLYKGYKFIKSKLI